MAKVKPTAKIGFEEQIWAAADILRGNMDAAEYKHVVLGLIFLKYTSDKFDERYQELANEEDDVEDKDAYTEKNIFFVPAIARWNVIAEAVHREEISTVIDDAMRAIERENKRLKDILPKNYARNELDKRRLGNVVDLFTNIRMTEHGENKDLLGSTYQSCLQQFASKEGKRGGEYYTPSCMVRTLVAILKPATEHRIYDPCCGSGGMFVQSEQFVKEHSGGRGTVSIYGQESNPTTRKLAMMNLAIRGIEANLGEFNADTFEAFDNGSLEDVKGFCAAVATEEIAKQDFILTPGRYGGIEEQEDDGEPFEEKMTRLTTELSEMFQRSHELEAEIKEKLGAIGFCLDASGPRGSGATGSKKKGPSRD